MQVHCLVNLEGVAGLRASVTLWLYHFGKTHCGLD